MPPSRAARMGYEVVVKHLLTTAGFSADSKREDGQTPLSWAVLGWHEAMVKLLVVTAGVNADSKDEGGRKSMLSVLRLSCLPFCRAWTMLRRRSMSKTCMIHLLCSCSASA